tara:strand:+ start:202 stop:336 length:135 start_codon:yes stop_codon:yes gene_type:complete
MRGKVTTAIESVGIALVVIGVSCFSVPIAVMAAGAALILIGERA